VLLSIYKGLLTVCVDGPRIVGTISLAGIIIRSTLTRSALPTTALSLNLTEISGIAKGGRGEPTRVAIRRR